MLSAIPFWVQSIIAPFLVIAISIVIYIVLEKRAIKPEPPKEEDVTDIAKEWKVIHGKKVS